MTPEDVSNWLERFTNAVNDKDYDGASLLFQSDVSAFGTRTYRVFDADQLRRKQWEKTWPHITKFNFFNTVQVQDKLAPSMALVVSQWETDDGKRIGRCSLLLIESRHGFNIQCAHSHFSLNPVPEFG